MKSKGKKDKKTVDRYTHDDTKRTNNPPVGLVTPGTDPDKPSKKYSFDPRLDPQLQWSGNQENSEFEIDTVSLHVHERIDPITILEKVMHPKQTTQQTMFNYFDSPENNPPLRDAIEFYKHDQNWSNRLIAGDSLLVMNSLLEKEGMEGKVQTIYMDPPYGIKYGSNFQPFVNKQDVKDGKDEDLTQEPEVIKAFRDTWELGIHSYLTHFKNRIKLAHKLLNDTGSIFVQISDENIHHVKEILDEVFLPQNFCSIIHFKKKAPQQSNTISTLGDFILWFCKDKTQIKARQLYVKKDFNDDNFTHVELNNGSITTVQKLNYEIPKTAKLFRTNTALTRRSIKNDFKLKLFNKIIKPPTKHGWVEDKSGMERLYKLNRLVDNPGPRMYKQYLDDFPYTILGNMWNDTMSAQNKIYVVQTSDKIVERCIVISSDPGDLVFDLTCGSGTTAYVAEKLGRRWITCDTSRISIACAKQRLITATYPYYKLKYSKEGIRGGFMYKTFKGITRKSLARNEDPDEISLFDQSLIDSTKSRISGPFTVEAVPAPTVKSMDVLSEDYSGSTYTSHQEQWREELSKTGIRGKSGQRIEFSRVETHPATKWLHVDAETKEEKSKRVMVSFGPEHAPLEQRQVAQALEEAQTLVPKPKMIIFAAMQFDPEAAKDIDELNWPDVTILKVEMNKDLLTEDLKKKRVSNESFWLMGQPDVALKRTKDEQYIITVNGFDYYNTRTGEIESGGSSKIAMWMLDTDYDGRSVCPQQIFFPMEGNVGGWVKLAKTLQAQIDEELITKYQGIESIPFDAGLNKRAAVKIIDDRGIESLKIIELE